MFPNDSPNHWLRTCNITLPLETLKCSSLTTNWISPVFLLLLAGSRERIHPLWRPPVPKVPICWRSKWMIFKSTWNQWVSETCPQNCLTLNWYSVLSVWSPNNTDVNDTSTWWQAAAPVTWVAPSSPPRPEAGDLVGTTLWLYCNQWSEAGPGECQVRVF